MTGIASKNMRVLFVLKEVEDEQLGIMYLASILKGHGYETGIIKADYGALFKKLQDDVPTILAYSTLGYYCNYYLELNKKIKKTFKVFSVFGGPYPTSDPGILDNEGVDAVCVGEGEYPLLELVDSLENGRDYSGIKNIWVRTGGRIYKNDPRPLIDNLDELPFPDRKIFSMKSPFFIDRVSMITSRGCLYNCPYCHNSIIRRVYGADNIYRRRSVDNVIKEIRAIREKQEVNFILFYDDIFILMPEWLREFSYKYARDVSIPFSCYVRINLVTPEIVSLLKNANCHSVSFGLETSSEYLRNSVLNRNMTQGDIVSGSRLFKDNGIRIRTTNIIGIPGGSIDSDIETLALNIRCGVDFARVSMFSVYPNTDFFISSGTPGPNFARYKDAPDAKLINMLSKYSISASGHFKRMIQPAIDFKYAFRNNSDKAKCINLQRLFGVTVGFPFIFPFVRLLICLPNNKLFVYLSFLWSNYCSYFRLYPTRGWVDLCRRISRHRKAISADKQ